MSAFNPSTLPVFEFKVSLMAIEKQFGDCEYDAGAEEIQAIIYETFGSADIKTTASIDDSHANPHYHTLCVTAIGIDGVTAGLVENELRRRGWVD